MLTQDQAAARIAMAAPPTDLAWAGAHPPSTWTLRPAEKGDTSWRIGRTHCGVLLSQPAGLGRRKRPTSAEVALHYATGILRDAHTTPRVVRRGTRSYPVRITNVRGRMSTTASFATLEITAHGGIHGVAYGYRNGDFALSAVALCGAGQWSAHRAQIIDYLQHGLRVREAL